MAAIEQIDKVVEWLLPFYMLSKSDCSRLNTPLRKCLRLLAAQHALTFQQDKVGNIYLSRPGRDPQLPPMGICFPLDGSVSPEAFEGALRAYFALERQSLVCGTILIGWSSLGERILGHDAWAGRSAGEDLYPAYPDLNQFASMADVAGFTISAIFEIAKSPSEHISVQGNVILVQKTEEAAKDMSNVTFSTATITTNSRAPEVRIEGQQAIELAVSAIGLYSNYVKAIFDNFD